MRRGRLLSSSGQRCSHRYGETCGTSASLFLFQSLRALGSATSQRPEQSADQVHEGAGGEGGGGGGAEEQRGGQQQQPRPRAGPVQAAGEFGLH